MFIKIKDEDGNEILVNASKIVYVEPQIKGTTGCIIYCNEYCFNSTTSYEEVEQKLLAVHRVIDAIKKRGSRNSYASMISGEIVENYTIRRCDLDLIETEESK